MATEDLDAPGYADTAFTFGGFNDGFHTIVASTTGHQNVASSDGIIMLEHFTVQ